MKEILSDMDLVSCLENIREEIQDLEFLNNGQVIFLNLDSFYAYIDDISLIKCGRGSDLKHRFSIIEPYIPMTVSEKHLELFMNAAAKKDNSIINDLDKFLDKVIKINFLNLIYQARTPQAWEDILQVCRTMRDFCEEESIQMKKSMYSSYFSKLF